MESIFICVMDDNNENSSSDDESEEKSIELEEVIIDCSSNNLDAFPTQAEETPGWDKPNKSKEAVRLAIASYWDQFTAGKSTPKSKRQRNKVTYFETENSEGIKNTSKNEVNTKTKKRKKKQKVQENEFGADRTLRLSRMSTYAAQRLANESPQQRKTRLAKMSVYAASRLAKETSEDRALRLARMSAYTARRLAAETPDQRTARLQRMSAYAARKKASKNKKT